MTNSVLIKSLSSDPTSISTLVSSWGEVAHRAIVMKSVLRSSNKQGLLRRTKQHLREVMLSISFVSILNERLWIRRNQIELFFYIGYLKNISFFITSSLCM